MRLLPQLAFFLLCKQLNFLLLLALQYFLFWTLPATLMLYGVPHYLDKKRNTL